MVTLNRLVEVDGRNDTNRSRHTNGSKETSHKGHVFIPRMRL